MLAVEGIGTFRDNYIWVIVGVNGQHVAIVDPGDASPVIRSLQAHHWEPAAILVTHHHADHIGGIEELVATYSLPVYGPADEPIPCLSHPLSDSARISPRGLGLELQVIRVPGHTAGHIAYLTDGAVFCGDTLFTGGCGRVFEGRPEEMYASLTRLASLPADTLVYCAHEYTRLTLQFAAMVEPENAALAARITEVERLRKQGLPTVPAPLAVEKATNPFLRCHLPTVRAAAERYARRPLGRPEDVFAALREWMDRGF